MERAVRLIYFALFAALCSGCSLDATIASTLADSSLVGPTDIKPTAAISAPSVSSTPLGTNVTWTVVFSDFATENFTDPSVTLHHTGGATDCVASVQSQSTGVYEVVVSGCTVTGDMTIEVAADSVQNAQGQSMAASKASPSMTWTPALVPTETISAPSPSSAMVGASVAWTVTFADFNNSNFSSSSVTLHHSGGTADCVVDVQWQGSGVYKVVVSACSATGTMNIEIAADSVQNISGVSMAASKTSSDMTWIPALPTGDNLLKSHKSGGVAQVKEIGILSGSGYVYNTELTASCYDIWRASGALCDLGASADLPYQVTTNAVGSTWSTGGDPSTVGYLIFDILSVQSVRSFSIFQMFSDGKTTHIQIFAHPSATTPYPDKNDAGWVELTSGMTSLSAQATDWSITTSPLIINLPSPINARYLKVHVMNDGSLGSPNYIELHSIKAFKDPI